MSKPHSISEPRNFSLDNKLRLAVLISGGGTNLQALIDSCSRPNYPALINIVISNQSKAGGIQRATNANIKTVIIEHEKFNGREQFEDQISTILEANEIELVCLAGFMRILGEKFVTKWKNRLINVHPSLLPSFKGLNTHQRALDAGVRITGCTVHYVEKDVDVGPIIVQAAVPVLEDDTKESLARRVLNEEHKIYPLAVELIARGAVEIRKKRVYVGIRPRAEKTIINPEI
jgi:phosphoribosylglycinamide formyltransferase-1